jgi:excisionase family DNA binding protein
MKQAAKKNALLADYAQLMEQANQLSVALSKFNGRLLKAVSVEPEDPEPVAVPAYVHKDILTMNEAVEYCGYSKSYTYQLVHANKIPYHKPNGKNGRIVFNRSELDEFIYQNKHAADYELSEKANAILNGEAR